MNPRVNQLEWTTSEVEEARSILVWVNNNNDNNNINHGKNKKHEITGKLQTWFPRKTMQRVTRLYVDLAAEMHMLHHPEKEYHGTNSDHGVSYTVDGLVNKNLRLEEEATMDGAEFLLGSPLESRQAMDSQEEVPTVEQNKVFLENKTCIHQPVLVPHAKGFWTPGEHMLFLHGLSICGCGKWKDISKDFVTTRIATQISSHAQKYFMSLKSKGLGSQRYIINDVELDDADPWKMENTFNLWQELALQSTVGVHN